MGLLLLGSLSVPVLAQGEIPNIMGMTEGSIDVSYDVSLTNNRVHNSWTPGDLTNTNLRYNVTSMKSPLDTFFNAGFFMGGDSSTPQPEFAINGTFEGSELFIKIVNDRTSINDPTDRMLDWQALLTLGTDIDISVQFPEGTTDPGIPLELIPTTYTIPAGSGTPPFPAVSSPTNLSTYKNLQALAKSYGFDGLPFISPAVFYVEDVVEAYNFWNGFVNQFGSFLFEQIILFF